MVFFNRLPIYSSAILEGKQFLAFSSIQHVKQVSELINNSAIQNSSSAHSQNKQAKTL